MTEPRHAAVLGSGAWGTCLALHLRDRGLGARLWARRDERREEIRKAGENRRYLPGVPVPPDLTITSRLGEALAGAWLVVFAVPSQHLRGIARAAARHLAPDALVVSATKGIEETTLRRMSEVLEEEIPATRGGRLAALLGPSHAEEVARRLPTALVSASRDRAAAEEVAETFRTDAFRVYTNDDLTGVELAVSLKNVIAIAAGICDGLGFGDNTRGALVTRGLAEMVRLGLAMGAAERTFWGLAGLGDLVTTCTSPHSRNRRVGEEIARGTALPSILERMGMVAEGVPTARSAHRLAARHGVEMPISREVHDVLFEGKDARAAIGALMGRAARAEVG